MPFLGKTYDEGTLVIAITFIFLAYILHPIVESTYHHVRAYHAWRALERNEPVEVTNYPLPAEVLQGRGKWDAARKISVLLLLFSVASWGLELSLRIRFVNEGTVDMYNRPPPVVVVVSDVDGNITTWKVLDNASEPELEFDTSILSDDGSRGNFKGTLDNGRATSIYRTLNNTLHSWSGVVETAHWSSDSCTSDTPLSYYNENNPGKATLEILDCDSDSKALRLNRNESEWGSVKECSSGPKISGNNDISTLPATIVLLSDNGGAFLIFEEEGSYLGFIYSVWETDSNVNEWNAENVTIQHMFFIASRFRLVEAIITGIVNGVKNGGGCVDLMLQHSYYVRYYSDEERARPFGEHPGANYDVDNLADVEPVEYGVGADEIATVCLVLVGIMSLLGIIWSSCLRSSIGVDVYNRDELIKAVTLPSYPTNSQHPAGMRIFVRKDETGHIDVIISDAGEGKRWCSNLCRRSSVVAQDEPAVAAVAHESGGNALPAGPRQVRLEGLRLGLGRDNFPRGWGPQSVSLSSSIVSSATSTPAHGTPAHGRGIESGQGEAIVRGLQALETMESIRSTSVGVGGSQSFHAKDLSSHSPANPAGILQQAL